jgi:hypothetical protein
MKMSNDHVHPIFQRILTPFAPKPDPRDPDYSRKGVFQDHNCYRCKNGTQPCIKANPRDCDTLHARND